MRRLLTAFCLSLGAILSIPVGAAAPAGKEAPSYLNQTEKKILEELNLARTKPLEYAKHIEEYKRHFRADNTVVVDGKTYTTKEGIKAVDEAIAFLKKVKPVSALKPSKGLSLAAKDHADDIGPKGVTAHEGSDKSQPGDRMLRHGKWEKTEGENLSFGFDDARAIVIQLIIDDGVPDRGHRKNVYDPDFKVVGVATGHHKVYRNLCVLDFAGGFKDK